MKVKVNRQLTGGLYRVSFEVGEFTADEIKKMGSFGVPTIQMQYTSPQGTFGTQQPINQINNMAAAVFRTEDQAKEYEAGVINQLRMAIQQIRERQDKFTSSEEVAL